jgi:hypothetical protein
MIGHRIESWMTLEKAILDAMPGTGREIAEKVTTLAIPQAARVTPNIVYAVMMANKKLVRRKLVSVNNKLVQYFEAK